MYRQCPQGKPLNKKRRHDEVKNQNQDGTQHHRVGGRGAHAGPCRTRIIAEKGGDQADDAAEHQALPEAPEQIFLELLTSYLEKNQVLPPGTQPVMVKGWGLPPLVEKSPYLMINRSHPLVKMAVRATGIEAANIELAASLIM